MCVCVCVCVCLFVDGWLKKGFCLQHFGAKLSGGFLCLNSSCVVLARK